MKITTVGIVSLHRARQGFVIARTAQANQIRSLTENLKELDKLVDEFEDPRSR